MRDERLRLDMLLRRGTQRSRDLLRRRMMAAVAVVPDLGQKPQPNFEGLLTLRPIRDE